MTLNLRKHVLSRVYLSALIMRTLEWEVDSVNTVQRCHVFVSVGLRVRWVYIWGRDQVQPPRLRLPESQDSQHTMVASLWAPCTGRLTRRRYPQYSFLLEAESTPWLGLSQWKMFSFTNRCTYLLVVESTKIYIKIHSKMLLHVSFCDHHQGARTGA
jgi:hypothetical protein